MPSRRPAAVLLAVLAAAPAAAEGELEPTVLDLLLAPPPPLTEAERARPMSLGPIRLPAAERAAEPAPEPAAPKDYGVGSGQGGGGTTTIELDFD